MIQIAADELDVMPDRIVLQSGDTDLTPNEGYTRAASRFSSAGLRSVWPARRSGFFISNMLPRPLPLQDLAVSNGAIVVARRRETITGACQPST